MSFLFLTQSGASSALVQGLILYSLKLSAKIKLLGVQPYESFQYCYHLKGVTICKYYHNNALKELFINNIQHY